ncbi:DUF1440 domain-containing protein [Staphylococcus sp. NRL 16/872]|uniref:DUF1440 domain-containing protein n=1 Tax=Staphylococcus sp. NRL 16/872 TaxID=2930131 RepID=UPI001FB26577|nr:MULTISPECIES: DUF1440 domain-containing protein [unclassified Staphylococcus]MCJ1655635.1 DUF1440 domain-containing protein [Staphylococcus sp. NRL 21/187]MCJ1661458.1 DUF1440 domain-containing protein [Staphylococcus sp. NRL 18/288]MCJ1667360.1 DUF1440 domain-containing protein [Staphylococcus sp. NRL 19/737]WEN69841.1 DUF1440 domain-containing protein [Staphylococcus sp. NRL 16/872]
MNQTTKRILITGVVGGLLSGAVKMGWEGLVPPRTPERDEEPPPMTLLNKLGLPENIKNATYRYNGNDVPITVMGIHYGFSVANGLAYGLLAEKCSKVTAFKGSLFGIAVHIAFHEYILPKLELTPPVKDLPIEERLSELFGHIVWMNTIDLVRHSGK